MNEEKFKPLKLQEKVFSHFQEVFLEKQNRDSLVDIIFTSNPNHNGEIQKTSLEKIEETPAQCEVQIQRKDLNQSNRLKNIDLNKNNLDYDFRNKIANDEIKKNNDIPEKKILGNTSCSLSQKVSYFIEKLKNGTSMRNLKQIKNNMDFLKFLNDNSYFYENNDKDINEKPQNYLGNSIFSKIIFFLKWTIFNKFLRKIHNFLNSDNLIIHPYNNLKILFDFLHFLFIIFWIFLIPLTWAFEEVDDFEDSISLYALVFFSIDILLNCNTSYNNRGVIESNRHKIISNYLKKDFFQDFITIIPLLICFPHNNSFNDDFLYKAIESIFLIKILKLRELISRVLEKLLLLEKTHYFMQLIKMIFFSLFAAHIFACLWYFTTLYEDSSSSWLAKAGIVSASWKTKYIYSIYWALVTIMTVGYGDITPTNEIEIVVCLITIIFGCVLYAFNINNVGVILKEINKADADFQSKINIINQFMNKKKISPDLKRRIREYLKFIWQEENLHNLNEEQQLLQMLSSSLREELLLESYGIMVQKHPLFSSNFSKKTLSKTVSIIKDQKFFPDEIIFTENEEDNAAIYFIKKGKIELFSEALESAKTLEIGEYFGEMSFFVGNKRLLSARSKDFTTLYSISRDDFLNILKNKKEDFEKYCMIKDNIIFNGDYSSLGTRCFSCNRMNHTLKECNFIHFIPDNEKIIKKLNFSVDNERQPFHRKKFKKNALSTFKKNNRAHKRFTKEKLIKLPDIDNASNLTASIVTSHLFDPSSLKTFRFKEEIQSKFNYFFKNS